MHAKLDVNMHRDDRSDVASTFDARASRAMHASFARCAVATTIEAQCQQVLGVRNQHLG
jgi:hypothetical protein